MKTVLLLDRSGLTTLYAHITPFLNDVNVIHVAYSKEEAEELNSYGITPDYIYLDQFKIEYDNAVYDDGTLERIDKDIIEFSGGRFNLNGAMQGDRGYTILSPEECIRSSVAHYRVWEAFLKQHKVDLLLHEPCSLFFNFIGCILCKKQGGNYLYQVASMSDILSYSYVNVYNDDFDYKEIKEKFQYFISNSSLIDYDRCNAFLNKFRKEQEAFFGSILNRRVPFLKLCRLAIITAIRNKAFMLFKATPQMRIYNNIKYWMACNNTALKRIKNLLMYKLKGVHFIKQLPEGEKYYFYPFHLEPEAVVLYLGGGIYQNQTKLIENIAASLPAGYYLYVKDHPHEYAYRDAIDYKRLMQVPNIRLINQWVSSKLIMKNAEGVITINGSAGFEAMLMNKQVYCFGHNMYSFVPRVQFVNHIKDLRPIIYSNINKDYHNDVELMAYIMAYLESGHYGYLDCYTGGPFIDSIDYYTVYKSVSDNIVSICNE